MSDVTVDTGDVRTRTPDEGEAPEPGAANWLKVGLGLLGVVVLVWALTNLFLAFGYYPEKFHSKFVIGVLALIGGVGGAALLFYFLNMFVEGLPRRISERVIPYAFLLPGIGLMTVMLLYPAILTINYSFANADSTAYVGLENYRTIFNDPDFRESILNNILWLLIVPAVTVSIGRGERAVY